MVGEVVLQQHVAVKTTHIRYGDDAAAAERAILRVQHFTLGNIGAEPAVRSAVQTEKRHIAGLVPSRVPRVTSGGRARAIIS